MILPYLNYACEIWVNKYKSSIDKVILLQKRAIRIVDKANYRYHTKPLFFNYKCLKYHDIVRLKTLIIVYQAYRDTLPMNLQKLFTKTSLIHNYNTRRSVSGCFDLKYCKTKTRSMVISIVGVKFWHNYMQIIEIKFPCQLSNLQ